MIHYLKTKVEYFEDLWSGRKTFEIRRNDRDYQVGDTLILGEDVAAAQCPRCVIAAVECIVRSDPGIALEADGVGLGIRMLEKIEDKLVHLSSELARHAAETVRNA